MKWNIASQLLEWLLSKREQTANVNEDVEKKESLCTIGENGNWWSQCGKQYEDFPKNQNRTTIWFSSSASE